LFSPEVWLLLLFEEDFLMNRERIEIVDYFSFLFAAAENFHFKEKKKAVPTSRYISEKWTSRYIYISLHTSNYISFEIDPLERYHSKDLVELSRMIVKLFGLDTFVQSYASLKLVELNGGSILKGFYFS
jgi:hypothetical protein